MSAMASPHCFLFVCVCVGVEKKKRRTEMKNHLKKIVTAAAANANNSAIMYEIRWA